MRAGVGDRVALVVVRHEGPRLDVCAEGELQHPHPRKPEALAQRRHFRGDLAQILGDQLRRSQRLEQPGSRSRPPAAVLRGGLPGGDFPVSGEADEMVEPHGIEPRERLRESLEPPMEAGPLERLPIIERVPPALAGRAEVVGRDAGNHRGLTLRVEEEQLPVGPDVGAVVGDEDGEVADQPDAQLVALVAQRLPVVVEEELFESVLVDLGAQGATGAIERSPIARAELRLPFRPRAVAPGLLDRGVEREVLQPACVRGAEGFEVRMIVRPPAVRGVGIAQLRHPPGARRRVVHASAAKARRVRERGAGEKTFLGQALEADEQRVPRERGVRAVRRVAVPERPDRQHLPPALPGIVQRARERVRLRPQVAAPVRTGERRQMEQDAACPLAQIEGHPCPTMEYRRQGRRPVFVPRIQSSWGESPPPGWLAEVPEGLSG